VNALYQIRDFSAHVREIEAFAGSERLALQKIDKQTWRIVGQGTIELKYTSYWDESGPFATQLNSEHAFINPAMILLYVPARRAGKSTRFEPNSWGLDTVAALPALDESMGGAHVIEFSASSYDAMADAPIEIGKIDLFELPE